MLATENLLQKLEEKMMALLGELEGLRKENHRLIEENNMLKGEKETNTRSLSELINLLDSVNTSEVTTAQEQHAAQVSNPPISALAKPALVQG